MIELFEVKSTQNVLTLIPLLHYVFASIMNKIQLNVLFPIQSNDIFFCVFHFSGGNWSVLWIALTFYLIRNIWWHLREFSAENSKVILSKSNIQSVRRIALDWNPQCKRRQGRPRITWRRTVENELGKAGAAWNEAESTAANRVRRRTFSEALCFHRSQRN